MADDEDWPELAWCPPGQNPPLAAVPLQPGDLKAGLTHRQYRDRLESRVLAMVQSDEDPQGAVASLVAALEGRGLWEAGVPEASDPAFQVMALLDDNPLWPDYLNLLVELPAADPMPVRHMPDMATLIRETPLDDWLSYV
jgi:hypothetical protein